MPRTKTPRRDPRFKGPVSKLKKKSGMSTKKAKATVREGNHMYRKQSPSLKGKGPVHKPTAKALAKKRKK